MGNAFVIEKQWLTDEGLEAVCLMMTDFGHRNGYVGVPRGTTLDGVDYSNFALRDITVHGGLSFSGGDGKYPVEDDKWWFGFDCAHYGDKTNLTNEPYDVERTLEYVENECESLAKQLSDKMVEIASWKERALESNKEKGE